MCGVGSGSHNHPLNFPRVFGCVGREELVEVNLILHFYPGLGQARDAGLAQSYVNNLPLPSRLCSLHLTCRIYLLLLSPLLPVVCWLLMLLSQSLSYLLMLSQLHQCSGLSTPLHHRSIKCFKTYFLSVRVVCMKWVLLCHSAQQKIN